MDNYARLEKKTVQNMFNSMCKNVFSLDKKLFLYSCHVSERK